MRHGISGNRLNRKSAHRKATLRDIAKATLLKQRICTTKAKAKEARKLVDKLITLGKKGTLADKRRAFAVLCNHKLVSDLFNKIAPRFTKRQGGYTRIISYGVRRGDSADLVFLELTEKEEVIVSKPKVKKAQKTEIKEVKKTLRGDKKEKASEFSAPAKEQPREDTSVKEAPKTSKKTEKAFHEKDKKSKKFVGGIRKMFNRKSPEK